MYLENVNKWNSCHIHSSYVFLDLQISKMSDARSLSKEEIAREIKEIFSYIKVLNILFIFSYAHQNVIFIEFKS